MKKTDFKRLRDEVVIYLCKQNINLDDYDEVQKALDKFEKAKLTIDEKGMIHCARRIKTRVYN